MRFDLAMVIVFYKLLETSSDYLLVSVAFAAAKEAISCDFRDKKMSAEEIDNLINKSVEENYSLCKLVEFREGIVTTSEDLNKLRLLSTAAKQYALIFRETLEEAQVA